MEWLHSHMKVIHVASTFCSSSGSVQCKAAVGEAVCMQHHGCMGLLRLEKLCGWAGGGAIPWVALDTHWSTHQIWNEAINSWYHGGDCRSAPCTVAVWYVSYLCAGVYTNLHYVTFSQASCRNKHHAMCKGAANILMSTKQDKSKSMSRISTAPNTVIPNEIVPP